MRWSSLLRRERRDAHIAGPIRKGKVERGTARRQPGTPRRPNLDSRSAGLKPASGGIKRYSQYFVPGVAGDHGEPIAQYIAVGGYLVTNNLSANAHGNGYADPNIYVSDALGNVTTDGGAFNVLEGNHALNLAFATYALASWQPESVRHPYRRLS